MRDAKMSASEIFHILKGLKQEVRQRYNNQNEALHYSR